MALKCPQRLENNEFFKEVVAVHINRQITLTDEIKNLLGGLAAIIPSDLVQQVREGAVNGHVYYSILKSQLMVRAHMRRLIAALEAKNTRVARTYAGYLMNYYLSVFGEDAAYSNYSINFKGMLELIDRLGDATARVATEQELRGMLTMVQADADAPLMKLILESAVLEQLIGLNIMQLGNLSMVGLQKQLSERMDKVAWDMKDSVGGFKVAVHESWIKRENVSASLVNLTSNVLRMKEFLSNRASQKTAEFFGTVANALHVSVEMLDPMRAMKKVAHARMYCMAVLLGVSLVTMLIGPMAQSAYAADLSTHMTHLDHLNAHTGAIDSAIVSSPHFMEFINKNLLSDFMGPTNIHDVAQVIHDHANVPNLRDVFGNNTFPTHDDSVSEFFNAAIKANHITDLDHMQKHQFIIVDIDGVINGQHVHQTVSDVQGHTFLDAMGQATARHDIVTLDSQKMSAFNDHVIKDVSSHVTIEPVKIDNHYGFGFVIQKTENITTLSNDAKDAIRDGVLKDPASPLKGPFALSNSEITITIKICKTMEEGSK